MNKSVAISNLIDLAKLTDNKIFLLYGTCLGAYRSEQILEHDKDTDVGILAEDFSFELLTKLVRHGFKIARIYGSLNFGLEIALKRNGVKTDLFVVYENEGRRWTSLWDNKCTKISRDCIIHSFTIDDFTNVVLNGYRFKAPVKSYLKQVYGDWKEEITVWNWRTDHHCIDEELKEKLLELYG